MGQCQSLHRQLYAIPMPSTTIVEIEKYGAGETFRKLTFAGNLSDVVSMLLSLYKRESPREQGKGNLSTEAPKCWCCSSEQVRRSIRLPVHRQLR